jgi:hypothetical protein
LENGLAFLMYLVQLLLPLARNDGSPIPHALYGDIREELLSRFGGLTAYTQSPAQGVWSHNGQKQQDDIAVVEVMVERLDDIWWRGFRQRLESVLEQESLVVRAFEIHCL